MDFKDYIKEIPDFPKPGILFRDIMPLLAAPDAFAGAVDAMIEKIGTLDFDYILGPESRGFIFGVAIACKMKKGFIPVRKAGKLPGETVQAAYALEYGTAVLEMQKGILKTGDKVIVVDDLLATGGTCKAIAENLVPQIGGSVVGAYFFVELEGLKGRALLGGLPVETVLRFE